jgi:pyruvate dehydrogenase E1 component alpha subunit
VTVDLDLYAPYRVLSEDGSELVAEPPAISDSELVALMAEMVKARVANGRFFSLQRQGRAGTYAPIEGQEAVVAGAAAALDPAHDWVLPQYREAVALGRYGPEVLKTYALYQRGHPGGGHFPAPVRVFPIQISLAAQIPHALGLAWAMQLKGEAGVACVFFGDGASSEGDFYEAGNFAGVLGAPVLFLCVNNGWAISTPLRHQTAATSFAAKAAAFGFPGMRVDGNDALAMFSLVAAARERAVRGGGPTLIEAVTFRMGPHTTADDPKRYQPPEDRAAWEHRDPIVRLRRHLEGRGLWDEERQAEAVAAAEAEIDAAWDAAEATGVAPDHFFDHVYAEPTPRMVTQRAELRARLGLDDPASPPGA